LLSAVLAAVAVLLYFPTLAHPFADYDDNNYVTANANVQEGLTASSLSWALTATEKSNWHPLTWISHELDVQFYGLNPVGHHLTSVILHAINGVLLFLALSLATRALTRSFLVALLFTVHPLGVESVVWIAERKNVLSTAFFLATVICYVWYVQRPSVARYATVISLFVFGLASKPMVITLPFVLLLLDYWPLQRVAGRGKRDSAVPRNQLPWRRLWLEKLPFFALCVVSAWLTIYAQGSGGAIKSLTDQPMGVRFRTAIWAYGEYVFKVLWPASLAPHYPHPGNTLAWWRIALAAVIVLAISTFAWLRRSSPYFLVGWLWFLGTLVPVIGLIQVGNQAMADRYAYLPFIGLLIALVWGGLDTFQRLKNGRTIITVVLPILVLALCWRTHQQVGFWSSNIELWSHTLQVTTRNAMAENNLGVALMKAGRSAEGLAHFQNSEQIDPTDPTSRFNIAAALQQQGRLQEAVVEYFRLIQTVSANPSTTANADFLATAYADLGLAFAQGGDYQRSRQFYQQALAINPLALNSMIDRCYQMLSARPDAATYTIVGEMLEESGRESEAQAAYRAALNLNPNQAEALRSMNQHP